VQTVFARPQLDVKAFENFLKRLAQLVWIRRSPAARR